MRFAELAQKTGLTFIFSAILGFSIFAQETVSPKRERVAKTEKTDSWDIVKSDEKKSDATVIATATPDGEQKDDPKNSRVANSSEEEAAILPYYNNYLREYHLGPEDVISVEVFGQPNYSKAGITIPPTAKIAYPLIPGGVFVGGKTTDQVGEEIKKKLDEYIIDPQVTVTLEKVGSAQFSVLGKVGTPGVRLMTRRYNVYDAIIEAGGIAPGGDKKRILLIRHTAQGGFSQTVVNFETLLSGKAEIPYLVPGDQIIVPEKKWSLTKIFDVVGKASAFRILFGVPF